MSKSVSANVWAHFFEHAMPRHMPMHAEAYAGGGWGCAQYQSERGDPKDEAKVEENGICADVAPAEELKGKGKGKNERRWTRRLGKAS